MTRKNYAQAETAERIQTQRRTEIRWDWSGWKRVTARSVHNCKMKRSVCLSAPFCLLGGLPSQSELAWCAWWHCDMCIENCHGNRLTKLFVSFTRCPCLFSMKILQEQRWFSSSSARGVSERKHRQRHSATATRKESVYMTTMIW